MKQKAFLIWMLTLGGIFSSTGKISAQSSVYKGMCDASAAVALDKNSFVVANDEDNELRIFDKNKPDVLQIIKLSEIFKDKILDGEDLEIDIEGAARLGDKIFWIGSHSTSKKGKFRAARNRLFAVQIVRDAGGKYTVRADGDIYTTLIADLERDSRFDNFKLKEAKAIIPKGIGGLSIEGLAAAPDGSMLIAFRNPLRGGTTQNDFLIGGKALIVRLLNPNEVITGASAKFDAPIELDLGGFGIRSLEYYAQKKELLIVAGPYHENEETPAHKRETNRVYTWSGKAGDSPALKGKIDLTGFNIEALFFYPKEKKFMSLFSDDGTICSKDSKNFRALNKKF